MRRPLWIKALPLFGFSFVEIAVAFVRAIILTRFLGSYEFGFASAISLTFATAGLVTDLAIHRFVLSTRRSEFSEALDGAHALLILRGFFIAAGLLIAAYPLSCTFASCNEWPSFAWLAPIIIISSFEHLEIRIAERDYRYWPQFTASLISHGLGLGALIITARETGNHYAFLAYLFVQVVVYVGVSQLLASHPYRARFKSPHFRKAFMFGFPLLLNGVALAVISQGDRFMVGGLLGLETLGIYTVFFLAGIVPISAVLRMLNPIIFAGLHNAGSAGQYASRLQFFARATPMIACCYALGLIALLKTALPLIFGARYAITDHIVLLLALIAFVRIVRVEPGTSLLLLTHKTGKLAVANISLAVGLFTATALVVVYGNVEAVLVGGLVGECMGLCCMIFMTQIMLKKAIIDYVVSLAAMMPIVVGAGLSVMSLPSGDDLFYRIALVGAFALPVLAAGGLFLPGIYRRSYKAGVSPATALEMPASKMAGINAQLPKTGDGPWN